MMGRHNRDQGQLFYSFDLDAIVPRDHLVREIAAVLDLSWVYKELAPHYSTMGRPSIDPVLMIRMLIIGYVFAIRSERALCREVQVNLAYRWFCGLIERTETCFGIKPQWLAADTAYGSASNLDWLVNQKGIAPHVPVIDKSKRDDGTFSRDAFIYDRDRDTYTCPAGKTLKTSGTLVNGGATLLYRASTSDCGPCLFKSQCCPVSPQRKVPRDIHEDARDVARGLARTEEFAKSRRDRKKVEMLFPGTRDSALMRDFHRASWPGRVEISDQFEDDRYRKIARRIVFNQRPDLLDDETRKAFSGAIARRWLSPDKVRWLTIEQALKEIDERREASSYEEALLLEGMEAFFKEKQAWAEECLRE